MQRIQELIDLLDQETGAAENYADRYLELIAIDNLVWAVKFKTMTLESLDHANTIKDLILLEIAKLTGASAVPAELSVIWKHAQAEYLAQATQVRRMLEA